MLHRIYMIICTLTGAGALAFAYIIFSAVFSHKIDSQFFDVALWIPFTIACAAVLLAFTGILGIILQKPSV